MTLRRLVRRRTRRWWAEYALPASAAALAIVAAVLR